MIWARSPAKAAARRRVREYPQIVVTDPDEQTAVWNHEIPGDYYPDDTTWASVDGLKRCHLVQVSMEAAAALEAA